jgi:hypothetical protein
MVQHCGEERLLDALAAETRCDWTRSALMWLIRGLPAPAVREGTLRDIEARYRMGWCVDLAHPRYLF